MRWLELTISTEQISSEAVTARLLESGAGGVAVEEHWDYARAKKDGLGDIFPTENRLPADTVMIRGYFPVSFLASLEYQDLSDFLEKLPHYGLAAAELTIRETDDADWENSWKDFWHPTPVGEKLLIVPAWYEAVDAGGRLIVRLDPGAAFGTGTHETTRLCLEWLETAVCGAEKMLDLGCGSGILALAAVKLGVKNVQAVDFDSIAIQAAMDNARLNHLQVHFMQGDLCLAQTWDKLIQADLICANLTADILVQILSYLPAVMQPRCKAVLSGIIESRRDDVVTSLPASLKLVRECSIGNWVALWLEMQP